jgi:fructose-bisphosphate aldolase class II
MPLVSMRQLLDHAAENGYGLPAFNVNNLEQVQAIMEAAAESTPGDHAGLGRRPQIRRRAFLRHLIEAALEAYPHIPVVMHQDHGQSPAVCMGAIRSGFSRDDGRLAAGGRQDALLLRIQRRGHPQGGRVSRTPSASPSKANSAASARSRPAGRQGRRPRRRGHADPRAAADRPDQAADFVKQTGATRWPSPSAPATAPTSSPASRPATSSPSTASRKSTPASPTPTW